MRKPVFTDFLETPGQYTPTTREPIRTGPVQGPKKPTLADIVAPKLTPEDTVRIEKTKAKTRSKKVLKPVRIGNDVYDYEFTGWDAMTPDQKRQAMELARADIIKNDPSADKEAYNRYQETKPTSALGEEISIYQNLGNAVLGQHPEMQGLETFSKSDAGRAINAGLKGASKAMEFKIPEGSSFNDGALQTALDLTVNGPSQVAGTLAGIVDPNADHLGRWQSGAEAGAMFIPGGIAAKEAKAIFDASRKLGIKFLPSFVKAVTKNAGEHWLFKKQPGLNDLPVGSGTGDAAKAREVFPIREDNTPYERVATPVDEALSSLPNAKRTQSHYNEAISAVKAEKAKTRPKSTMYKNLDRFQKELEKARLNNEIHPVVADMEAEYRKSMGLPEPTKTKEFGALGEEIPLQVDPASGAVTPPKPHFTNGDEPIGGMSGNVDDMAIDPITGLPFETPARTIDPFPASSIDPQATTLKPTAGTKQERLSALFDELESFDRDGTPANEARFDDIRRKIQDVNAEPDDVIPGAGFDPSATGSRPSMMNDLEPNANMASEQYGRATYDAALEAGMSEAQARASMAVAYKTAREAERMGLDVPSVVAAKLDEIDPTGKLAQKVSGSQGAVVPTAKFPDQWRVTDPSRNQELVDQIYIPGTPVGFVEKQIADLIASGEPLAIPGGPPNAKPFQYYLDKTIEGYNADASFWYSDLGRLAESALGKDNVEEFAQAWSVFSPQKKPEQNFQEAVAAMFAARRNPQLIARLRSGDESVLPLLRQEFHKTGIMSQSGKVGKAFVTNEQIDNVMKALADHEQRKGGFKTRNFEGDSSSVVTGEYRTGSTQDRHQAGFYEYGKDVISGPSEFRWTMAVTNAIAQKLGTSPKQTQAAQWFIQKFGKGHGVQGGFKSTEDAIAHLKPAMDAEIKGNSPMWTGEARGTQLSTDPRKFAGDFPISTPGSISEEAGRRNAANVIVESRPSFTLSPEMAALPDSMQELLNQKLMDAVFPGGQNRAYNAFDITHRTGAGAGSFEGVVSPNYGVSVLGGSMPKANLVGAIEGKLNLQDAVAIIKPDFFEREGAILATFRPGPLSRADLEALKDRLTKEGLDFTLKPDGEVVIGNFGDNPDFGGIIQGLEGDYGKAKTTGTSGSYLDRTANLPGAGEANLYATGFGSPDEALGLARDRIVPSGRPDLRRLVRDTLIEPRVATYEEIAKNAGLDPRPIRSQIESAGKEVLDRLGLTQMEQDKLKGLYDRLTNRVTFIKGNADISTTIHENGHVLKEILLKGDDADLIRKFYGDSADVAGHERFARDLEGYFRTGKAPDSKLAQVFESIKNWMRDIYTKGVGDKIDPEVKAIFDRVYGQSDARTDEFFKAFESSVDAVPTKAPKSASVPGAAATARGAANAMNDIEPNPPHTSARNESVVSDRRAMNNPELESPIRKTMGQSYDESITKGYDDGWAKRTADSIVSDPRALDDAETAGMVRANAKLKAKYDELIEKAKTAPEEDLAGIRKEMDDIESAHEIQTRALNASGTVKGRALNAQKFALDNNFDLLTLRSKMKINADGSIPDKLNKKLTEVHAEYQKIISGMDEKIKKLSDDLVKANAARRTIKETGLTKDSTAAMRNKAKEEWLKASGQQMSAMNALALNDATPEMIRAFSKYVRSVISDGAKSAEDIIRTMANDGVKVDHEDIYTALTAKTGLSKLSDLQKELNQLKTQIKNEAGEAAFPGLIKQKKADAAAKAAQTRMEKMPDQLRARIADIEHQINTGNYVEAQPKKAVEYTEEIYNLKAKKQAKEKELNHLVGLAKRKTWDESAGQILTELKLLNVAPRVKDLVSNAVVMADRGASALPRYIVDKAVSKVTKSAPNISWANSPERVQRTLGRIKSTGKQDIMLALKGIDSDAAKKWGSGQGPGTRAAALTDAPFKAVYKEFANDLFADVKARSELGKGATDAEVSALREKILGNLEDHPDVTQAADQYSLHATFNNDNLVSEVLGYTKRRIKSKAGKVAFDELIARFSKVITNVAIDKWDRTPFGLATNVAKVLANKDTLTAAERLIVTDRLTKGLTGSALLALGYYAGEKIPVEFKGTFKKYADFGDLGEVGGAISPFLMGVVARNAKNLKEEERNGVWLGMVTDMLTNSPAASNLKDTLNTLNDPGDGALAKFVARKATNAVIPGLVRDIAKRMDAEGPMGILTGKEIERQKVPQVEGSKGKMKNSTKFSDIIKGEFASKIPVLRQRLPKKEEAKKKESEKKESKKIPLDKLFRE